MKINWFVRFKNKNFWVSFIPAMLLLIQILASLIDLNLEIDELGDKLLAVINAVFLVLAILGVVTDPTTSGVSDSKRAMDYTEPN